MHREILLVEDEVAVRDFYQLYLEHHGFRVCPASGPLEAIRVLGERCIHLAIIDVFLGEDNGLDLVRGMKAARPELPVIIMSGMSYDEPKFQEPLTTGADGIYSKTLALSQLLMDVKRLLQVRPGLGTASQSRGV